VRGWFCGSDIPDLILVCGFKELILSTAPYIVAGGTWLECSVYIFKIDFGATLPRKQKQQQ
jgi:hypothetical protein